MPDRMIVKRNTYYYLQPKTGNKYKAIPLGPVLEDDRSYPESLSAALAKYEKLATQFTGTETVGWLIYLWLENGMKGYEANTCADYRRMSVIIGKYLGKLKISEIRPVHIADFIDKHYGDKPNSANKYKALLSNIFNYAIRRGMRDDNPGRSLEPLVEGKRRRYISDLELVLIVEAAIPMMKVLVQLAAMTGQRMGDLLRLEWKAVLADAVMLDVEEADDMPIRSDGVVFYPSKTAKTTGQRVAIAMTDQLRATFEYAKQLNTVGSAYVIHKKDGTPYKYDGAYSSFQRALQIAERHYLIDCAERRIKPKPGIFQNLHFHDLKRKALTDSKYQGNDPQALGGHASARMTERYYENAPEVPPTYVLPTKIPVATSA